MVSELASAHFNTLIKILSNASKLDCQTAVARTGRRFWSHAGLFEQAALLGWLWAGLVRVNVLLFIFCELGVMRLALIVGEMWPKNKMTSYDILLLRYFPDDK